MVLHIIRDPSTELFYYHVTNKPYPPDLSKYSHETNSYHILVLFPYITILLSDLYVLEYIPY